MRRLSGSPTVTNTLGIDIGLFTIKTVLMEWSESGTAMRHAGILPMPAGALTRGIVTDKKAVAELLREMVQGLGGPVKQAVVTIPTEHLFARWLDLPRMEPHNLRAATRFEAKKHLPYAVESAVVEIIPEHTGLVGDHTGKMRALLLAVPSGVAESRAEAVERAGLEVSRMDAEPFCLLRSLHPDHGVRRPFWRDMPVTYLHLGEETSALAVLQDTALRFVHPIAWGGARLTQALVSELGLTAAEARALKEQPGVELLPDGRFTWEHGAKQSNALAAELDRLRREIQRLMNYYSSLFPESSYESVLSRMVISGGTAGFAGLERYFATAGQVNTEKHRCRISLGAKETTFAAAFGAALAERPIGKLEMNDGATAPLLWRQEAA